MDSTILHWLLRIQQLEVSDTEQCCRTPAKVPRRRSTYEHSVVQAIIKTRNDELHAHHARLAKIQQKWHDTVNEQV